MWHVVFVLATVGSAVCGNEIEFAESSEDDYNNQIFLEQQEGDPRSPPDRADLSRWDKLFIALEDSHMRQNMLLASAERCCGERSQLDALLKETFRQYAPSLVSVCRAQAEQAGLRLRDTLVQLGRDGAEMERRINATLELVLQSRYEEMARLKRLEEAVASLSAGGRWSGPLPSGLEEQEMTPPGEADTTTGRQRVHLQLSEVMEQAGEWRETRGDA
ncbi:uncharacterized protein LOC106525546 [Austrofundulus limnaeus]|uniref:Uncharacterized protein LOC106525546 n=1 Tax=Austrofundulus limnaeus TaxID=52670 RepID=A0A2I4C5L4_AUSLI|nr:PREDICTED: uncharacterized protein LOC106525546 [Austrofundulus limnaeus]